MRLDTARFELETMITKTLNKVLRLRIGIRHILIISVKNHETNITIKTIMQQLGEHHLALGKIIDEIIKCHKTNFVSSIKMKSKHSQV